eukprot:gene17895-21307_t
MSISLPLPILNLGMRVGSQYSHTMNILTTVWLSITSAAAAKSWPVGAHVAVGTELGEVVGTVEDGWEVFKGIPYAEAPVKDLRFAPAQPVAPWRTQLDATAFRSPCLQDPRADPSQQPNPEAPPPSEDCLFLNIWRPAREQRADCLDEACPPLPVMVWIHGGGFMAGAGSSGWMWGGHLARDQKAVVVSLNYRLGVLGFLVSDELESTYGGNGGLNGVQDQIVALRWVQRHISAFGGSPRHVTIFGESSGGMSTCLLTVSPEAQ